MYLFTNEIQSFQAIDESIKRRKEMILCLPKRIIKFCVSVQNTLLIMVNLEKKLYNESSIATISHVNMEKRFSICVYETNDIVSKAVRGRGGWEREILSYMNNYMIQYSKNYNVSLSDLTFIDIGANVGWFSLNMAALGVNVLAFEPMEENIQLIKKSLELKENIDSGVSDRITLYPYGLGIKEETCYLYSDNLNVGDGHVNCVEHESEVHLQENYSIHGKIDVKRLDDIIKLEGIAVPVVKMDVEGYEANVFEGESKTF